MSLGLCLDHTFGSYSQFSLSIFWITFNLNPGTVFKEIVLLIITSLLGNKNNHNNGEEL